MTDGVVATQSSPTLSVTAIQNAVAVIDYASEQGAFKGWKTIQEVFAVRNILNDFVVAVTPPTETTIEPTV